MRRVSITLEKAETLRVFGREQLRRDSLYLLQGTRLWSVDGVPNHQGIGVVHLRALVVRRPRVALVAPEHAGEWRKAKDLDRFAKEKMRFDVECRLFAGRRTKLKAPLTLGLSSRAKNCSSRASGAGLQSQNSWNVGNSSGMFSAVSNRQAARRDSVNLSGGESAEVARAEHGNHFIDRFAMIERIEQPKTGETKF